MKIFKVPPRVGESVIAEKSVKVGQIALIRQILTYTLERVNDVVPLPLQVE